MEIMANLSDEISSFTGDMGWEINVHIHYSLIGLFRCPGFKWRLTYQKFVAENTKSPDINLQILQQLSKSFIKLIIFIYNYIPLPI